MKPSQANVTQGRADLWQECTGPSSGSTGNRFPQARAQLQETIRSHLTGLCFVISQLLGETF